MKAPAHAISAVLWAVACSAIGQSTASKASDEEAAKAIDVVKKTTGEQNDWTDFIADSSAGQVTAAGLLGLTGDAVQPVENVKGLVAAFKSGAARGEKAAFGLSVTPARTMFAPMNLSTYAGGFPARLLGNLTLGYAQGSAEVSGQTFDRRAFSVETSAYLRRQDDPVLAYGMALANGGGDCDIFGPPTPPDPAPVSNGTSTVPKVVDGAEVKARAEKCRDTVKNRWNASRIALAYGAGRITNSTAGEHSLGRTVALTVHYGFEHVGRLSDSHGLAMTWRRSSREPVLQSLTTATPVFKDTRLTALRYTVGSPRWKALVEGTNAGEAQPTASQTVLKRALGLDLKVQDDVWLSLRLGKRRKIDGSSEETASLLNLSWSPKAVLKP